MSWYDEAKSKLEAEKEAKGWGSKEKVMAPHVAKALTEFCRQSEDFAEKVAHGGSFEECMKAVGKNVGSSISDIEAYRRAAKFYAKGCDVKFRMEIVEQGAAAPHQSSATTASPQGEAVVKEEKPKATVIDLTAFL